LDDLALHFTKLFNKDFSTRKLPHGNTSHNQKLYSSATHTKLGLHPDDPTVRPLRDCLVTKNFISSLKKPDSPKLLAATNQQVVQGEKVELLIWRGLLWCGSCGYSVTFRLRSGVLVLVMKLYLHGGANPIRWIIRFRRKCPFSSLVTQPPRKVVTGVWATARLRFSVVRNVRQSR